MTDTYQPLDERTGADLVPELDESTDPPTPTGRLLNRWTGEVAADLSDVTAGTAEAAPGETSGSQAPETGESGAEAQP